MSRVVGGTVATLALAAVVFLGMVGIGSAAFPGPNGRITLQVVQFSGQSASINIGSVNPDGSGLRLLTALKPGGAEAFFAAWSPTGARVAFDLGNPAGGSSIWVMNADGTGKRLVARGRTNGVVRIYSPFWLGRRRIVFVRAASGPSSIWVARADGVGRPHQLIAAPRNTSLDLPAVSPNGRWILVTEETSTGTALAIADSNGKGLHVIPGTGTLNAFGGDFSPNGRWIITSNNATNGKISSLVVLHPDGSGAHQITRPGSHLYNDLYPVWSPDGTKVAFTRSPCPTPKKGCLFSHVAIWVANADGSGAHAIIGPSPTDAAEYLVPDWGRRPR